jgi:hypothetical protein
MLGLIHIVIILAVSVLCYFIFYRTNIINNKKENFSSNHVNFHQGNDYNVVSYNYNLEDDPQDDHQDNNQDIDNNQ